MAIMIGLSILGLCFGSFVNALVWRLKKKRNFVSERSECTHCHHMLAWYDLVPVLSWLLLGGKCRYCHKKIDDSPITELAVASVFGLSYVFWPYSFSAGGTTLLAVWLVSVVLLAALFLYDLKWMILPDKLTFPLIGLGVLWMIIYYTLVVPASPEVVLQEVLFGLVSVAGLYGLLYFFSKGSWVGFGDVKLGVFMGLVLGWTGGLLAVMLANLIAFCFIMPGLMTGRVKRTNRIPFGPFLIIATVIAMLWKVNIVNWYLSAALFGVTLVL